MPPHVSTAELRPRHGAISIAAARSALSAPAWRGPQLRGDAGGELKASRSSRIICRMAERAASSEPRAPTAKPWPEAVAHLLLVLQSLTFARLLVLGKLRSFHQREKATAATASPSSLVSASTSEAPGLQSKCTCS